MFGFFKVHSIVDEGIVVQESLWAFPSQSHALKAARKAVEGDFGEELRIYSQDEFNRLEIPFIERT